MTSPKKNAQEGFGSTTKNINQQLKRIVGRNEKPNPLWEASKCNPGGERKAFKIRKNL